MKKIIGSIVAAILVVTQALLPLTNDAIGLGYRLLIALAFLLFWILYILFADQIEYFICRNILGRELVHKTREQKYNDFYNDIEPECRLINDGLNQRIENEFVKNVLFHKWCKVINFILDYCCIANKKIDYDVVCYESETYVADFRKIKIDPLYIKEIILVLNQFCVLNYNILKNYPDIKEQIKRLKRINAIFNVNDNQFNL